MLKERAEPALAVKKNSKPEIDSAVLAGEPYKLEDISQLGIPALKILAKAYSTANIYLKIENLDRGDEPEAIIHLGMAELENEFSMALSTVCSFFDEGDSEILKSAGVLLPPGNSYEERVALAYLKQSADFQEAYTRKLSTDKYSGRAFTFFKIAEGIILPQGKISKAQEIQAKSLCRSHFESQDCGPALAVHRYQTEDRIGFRVWHGSPFRNNAGINRKEKHKSEELRKEHTDILFIDHSLRVCWIDSKKEHIALYTNLLSKVLLGNAEAIKDSVSLNLQFALAHDLEDRIVRATGPEIERVRISLRVITGLRGGKRIQPVGRSECVSHVFPIDSEIEGGVVTEVKVSIELRAEKGPRPRGTIAIKGNQVTFPKQIPDAISCMVLKQLGVLPSNDN